MWKALRWADSIRNSCRSPLSCLIHPLSLKETAQSLCPQPVHIAHHLQMGPRRQHQGLLVPLSEWQLTCTWTYMCHRWGKGTLTAGTHCTETQGAESTGSTAQQITSQRLAGKHNLQRLCLNVFPCLQGLSPVFFTNTTFLIFLADVSLVTPWVLSNMLLNFTFGGILLSLFDLLVGLLRWGSTL